MEKPAGDCVAVREDHALTRRRLMQSLVGVLGPTVVATNAGAAGGFFQDGQNGEHAMPFRPPNRFTQPTAVTAAVPLSPSVLPAGIRSRFVNNINGLRMHVLEAGFE